MPLVAYSLLDRLEKGSANDDPLGFFTYATRLANEWLPGITTRTRRIRYYSMICGGLHIIEDVFKEQIRNASNADEETTRLFMRWERIWASWNGAVETKETGMIGKNKVSMLFKDDYFKCSTADYPFIQRQNDLGALGAYHTSLSALGFLAPDCLQLTGDGRRLGELFWSQSGNNRVRNQSAHVLDNGKFTFPRHKSRLAEYAATFGLAVRSDTPSPDSLGKERILIRNKLLPIDGNGVRRHKVIEYINHHKWADLDEFEILAKAARRGQSLTRNTEYLERCAAVIVALEAFRFAALDLLDEFRIHLYNLGRGDSPSNVASSNAKKATARVNFTHRQLLRFVKAAEFHHVFRDFPMADCNNGQSSGAWLADLLAIHQAEMAKRRSPRWFLPSGGNRWTLDSSVCSHVDVGNRVAAYSYRTNNLLNMARETGLKI